MAGGGGVKGETDDGGGEGDDGAGGREGRRGRVSSTRKRDEVGRGDGTDGPLLGICGL